MCHVKEACKQMLRYNNWELMIQWRVSNCIANRTMMLGCIEQNTIIREIVNLYSGYDSAQCKTIEDEIYRGKIRTLQCATI